MIVFDALTCTVLVVLLNNQIISAQLPPRLAIPGALLLPQARPLPFRQQRILQSDASPPPRLRRPIPNAVPVPIRPVVEEEEELGPSASPIPNFDDEVNKLGISALQSAVRQASAGNEDEPAPKPSPLPFRPERPIPVLRDNIRDTPPAPKPLPILRQEVLRPRPIPKEYPEEPIRQPIRQQARQQSVPQQQPQAFRQQARPAPAPRPPSQYLDENHNRHNGRTRKPPVQILRKYRTDNPDGSITWGYENEDGTFKEETLGNDCITRGKYGYIDPDGVRRQYSYETGNKCDQPELEPEQLVPEGKALPLQVKKPQFRPHPSQF